MTEGRGIDQETLYRYVVYVTESLGRAEAAFDRGRGGAEEAIASFGEALPHVRRITALLAECTGTDDVRKAYVEMLVASPFLSDNLLNPKERLELLRDGLRLMPEGVEVRTRNRLMGHIAQAYFDVGDEERAYGYALQYRDGASNSGDPSGVARAAGLLAHIERERGALAVARNLYRTQLRMARDTIDPMNEVAALSGLGVVCRRQGKLRRAIVLHEAERCRALFCAGYRMTGPALGSLARCYSLLGDLPRSIALLTERLGIARTMEDQRAEAIASWHLGMAHAADERYELAEELMAVMIAWARATGRDIGSEAGREYERVQSKARGQGERARDEY